MNIAQRIEASGLGDRELAARSGLHLATINRYRRGLIEPRELRHIKALADVLGCSPADIRPDLAALFDDKRA